MRPFVRLLDAGSRLEWLANTHSAMHCSDRLQRNPNSGLSSALHLPGARCARLEYDALGRLTAQTDSLGQSTQYPARSRHRAR
jgi:YD repeat-containing protein